MKERQADRYGVEKGATEVCEVIIKNGEGKTNGYKEKYPKYRNLRGA